MIDRNMASVDMRAKIGTIHTYIFREVYWSQRARQEQTALRARSSQ